MRATPFFTEEELQRIYAGAYQVLETIGLAVDDARAREKLAGVPGLRVCEGRVLMERRAVEAAFEARNADFHITFPCRLPEVPASEIQLAAGWTALNIVRYGDEAPRPITTAEVIEGARVVRALAPRRICGGLVGQPRDVPPMLQALHTQMLSCIHAGRPINLFGLAVNEAQYELDRQMREVMGCADELVCHLISPLRLAGNDLELALRFGAKTVKIGNMPQNGVTAPVSLPAMFTQSMAEMLGANCALRALLPGALVDFSVGAQATDFRTGAMVFGSPGALLVEAAGFQCRAWMGCGLGGRFMRTHAVLPGVQSAADKAAGATLGALVGCRAFNSAGHMAMDEVFCPEQLLLDVEIRDFVAQAAAGCAKDTAAFDLAVIREGVAKGEFMSLENTVAGFREYAWKGGLFHYGMLSTWLAAGRPQEGARLREMYQELAKRELPPALDDTRQRAIMKLYTEARKRFG